MSGTSHSNVHFQGRSDVGSLRKLEGERNDEFANEEHGSGENFDFEVGIGDDDSNLCSSCEFQIGGSPSSYEVLEEGTSLQIQIEIDEEVVAKEVEIVFVEYEKSYEPVVDEEIENLDKDLADLLERLKGMIDENFFGRIRKLVIQAKESLRTDTGGGFGDFDRAFSEFLSGDRADLGSVVEILKQYDAD
ncbi:hypothetical protein MHSWG343_01100 [Candidatus Mycoplasma haematohominis]|uniref:Uncharacterized protein n=1 Tax=Candidatus Mycoplasma haematohominis TaxID=1494318 RepID=A0A478FPH3_9MOLU|nr:hypothetical protein MHSWG343_01100 [Candidatus Mycoplasma haemohominis]